MCQENTCKLQQYAEYCMCREIFLKAKLEGSQTSATRKTL